MDIKSLQEEVMNNKVSKGFNTTDIPLEFMLLTGEVSEAFDAWRKKKSDLGEEIADVMIYLLGLSKMLDINLEDELVAKIEKNRERKYVRKNGTLVKEEN
ncbi:hypothetical protein FBF31_00585 [Candidatus Saccharibacteria bacterium oral taxon 955]|nr:hypothetical protein FBF33_00585 [Candidatus Saccharibacteria bacterium oral taxon 955]QJU06273.1 hypothetical protein FBF31_00585 [Candidatus Saccharibacteria bacterium oral taxon 955]